MSDQVVYQCLYSQCPTAQFGAALHHTLGFCSSQEERLEPTATVPALLRHQNDLKKRATPTNMQSRSVSASAPTRPRTRQSVSASAFMTFNTQRARPTDTFLKAFLNPYPNGIHGVRRRPDEPLFRLAPGDPTDS